MCTCNDCRRSKSVRLGEPTSWNGAWRCNECHARYSESGWTGQGAPVCPSCGAQNATPIDYNDQPVAAAEPRIYRIIRFRFNSAPRTVRNNVTLSEAQAHCSRPDTHGTRAGVRWFDGYDYMRGCAPKER